MSETTLAVFELSMFADVGPNFLLEWEEFVRKELSVIQATRSKDENV